MIYSQASFSYNIFNGNSSHKIKYITVIVIIIIIWKGCSLINYSITNHSKKITFESSFPFCVNRSILSHLFNYLSNYISVLKACITRTQFHMICTWQCGQLQVNISTPSLKQNNFKTNQQRENSTSVIKETKMKHQINKVELTSIFHVLFSTFTCNQNTKFSWSSHTRNS